jgi:hypothetical protein
LRVFRHAFAIVASEFFRGERLQLRRNEAVWDLRQINGIVALRENYSVHADVLIAFRQESARIFQEQSRGVEALILGQVHLPDVIGVERVAPEARVILRHRPRKAAGGQGPQKHPKNQFQPSDHVGIGLLELENDSNKPPCFSQFAPFPHVQIVWLRLQPRRAFACLEQVKYRMNTHE